IRAAKADHHAMELIFLANIPGEFIVKHRIVEQYYGLRLHFAATGRAALTDSMKREFERVFNVPADKADIVGAFQALETLNKEPEELFDTWVGNQDVATIAGQCIKKIGEQFVINYDVPALLHKNSKQTDIAVMLFRTSLSYAEIRPIIAEMHNVICNAGM